MRLLLNELDKRVRIKLNKSIKPGNSNGIMDFGEKNDYPQTIERIINESVTARSITRIFAKFLVGQGFENELINKVVIGKDQRGKDIVLINLLRQMAYDLSMHSGGYIHCAENALGKIKEIKHIPFKYCRFTKLDDTGYCAKVAVYDNWEKDTDIKFDKEKIKTYPIFNLIPEVFKSNVEDFGGFEKFDGQVNFLFFDNQYLYPLSPIDPVYLDCDTEAQIAIYKNNQLRNGFFDKVVFRVQPPNSEEEREKLANKIKGFIGPDGDPVLVMEDDLDPETGEIKATGAFKVDAIKSNINDKLFESWEKSLANNIRKAYMALPAVLIDYEESKLGNTSGEAIQQAVSFYNSITEDFRTEISEFMKETLIHFDNEILATNKNWKIKPLQLNGTNTNILGATGNQAN